MNYEYILSNDNITKEQLRKYNVNELQGLLNYLGISYNGKKGELVERVYQVARGTNTGNNEKSIVPTNCIMFQLPKNENYNEIRQKVEYFGQISTFLILPDHNKCYVLYKFLESAKDFLEGAEKIGLKNLEYYSEQDMEKLSKEYKLIDSNKSFSSINQKIFNKTSFEPRIFWSPKIEIEEEEEDLNN